MELRQIAALRLFSQPVRASGRSEDGNPTDVVTLGEPIPEAPRRPLIQDATERLGPLQGALTYLVGRSVWPERYPISADEVAQAFKTLRDQLSEGPIPPATLVTMVDLVKSSRTQKGPVAPALAAQLEEWRQAGRLEVLGEDGKPAEKVNLNTFSQVVDGRILQSKTGGERFKLHEYRKLERQDPEAAARYLDDSVRRLRGSGSEFGELLKKPETAEILKPYMAFLLEAPARQIQAGGVNANHEELIVVQTLKAFPQQDPKVVAGALGPILRQGVQTSLAVKYAEKYLGASWVLDQIARRDPMLPPPEFALRDIYDSWTPNREEVGKIVGLAQVPPGDSLLVGPVSDSLTGAVALLSKAPPEMLEGWTVGGRDFRDALLERVISDRPPETEKDWAVSQLVPFYPYPYQGARYLPETLGPVLFSGPRGEERRERALQDLKRGLEQVPPGQPLPDRQLFLAGLLLGSHAERPFLERLMQVMKSHTDAPDSEHGPTLKLVQHLRAQAFWHELCDRSPRETLTSNFDHVRLPLENGVKEKFILRRWADHVSSDANGELKNALAVLDGPTAAAMMPLFTQALTEGRLQEAFGMLEQAGALDLANAAHLFQTAKLDRLAFHQELTGYRAAGEIFKREGSLLRDILEAHKALGALGPRREAVTEALRTIVPNLFDPPGNLATFVGQVAELCGDREGDALKQRVDRLQSLLQRQVNTLEQPEVFWAIENSRSPAQAFQRYEQLDETMGYPHTDPTFLAMGEAALALGGSFAEVDELLAWHESLGAPKDVTCADFQKTCKLLADGRSLQSVRQSLLGIEVHPETGGGLQDSAAAVRLPGVMLRKRS